MCGSIVLSGPLPGLVDSATGARLYTLVVVTSPSCVWSESLTISCPEYSGQVDLSLHMSRMPGVSDWVIGAGVWGDC